MALYYLPQDECNPGENTFNDDFPDWLGVQLLPEIAREYFGTEGFDLDVGISLLLINFYL